jgi:hypothetical protein
MTRRKHEITGLANEQDFPHLVELAVPPEGFGRGFLDFDAFHRERRIPVRRGQSRHEVSSQFYIRFCFPDAATADAFRNRFGGECLTHAPGKPKPRTSATSSDPPAVTREEENWGKGR